MLGLWDTKARESECLPTMKAQSEKGTQLTELIMLAKARPELKQELNGITQFSSVSQSCPALCDLMDCSTPSFPVLLIHPKPSGRNGLQILNFAMEK